MNETVPEDYKPLSLVCLREDGAYESPGTVSLVCKSAKKIKGLEDFHFHTLRHTFTSNLLTYVMERHRKKFRSYLDMLM